MHSPIERIEKTGADFLGALQNNIYVWLCFLFTLVLLLNGPDTTDLGDFMDMSQRPFHINADASRQFLYSSPLNFLIAGLTGLTSEFWFFVFHICEILLMLACVGASVRHKIPKTKQQLLLLTLISLTPLWLIIIKWIGKTDPVLVGGLFLCWAFRTRWRVLVAMVMIAAHREIGSLMVLSLFLLEEKKDTNLLVALLGANALHLVYQYGILDHAPQTRASLMTDKGRAFLSAIPNMPMLYIMSMLTWYWVVVVKSKLAATEAGLLIVALFLSLINEDFTRDFILAALPAVLFHAERMALSDKGSFWENAWPLAPLQFQVATFGHVAYTKNVLVDELVRLCRAMH